MAFMSEADAPAQLGRVGIHIGTNHTREARQALLDPLREAGWKVIFLETIINDENLRQRLINQQCGNDGAEAFSAMREEFVTSYEPMNAEFDADLRFIKLIDAGRQVQINNIEGYLPGRIVQFVMNLTSGTKPLS